MGTAKNIKVYNFCNTLERELQNMKDSIAMLRNEAKTAYGVGSGEYMTYEAHLAELSGMIDWKIDLLMRSCPFDWKGVREIEDTVSVDAAAPADYSGGYVGG